MTTWWKAALLLALVSCGPPLESLGRRVARDPACYVTEHQFVPSEPFRCGCAASIEVEGWSICTLPITCHTTEYWKVFWVCPGGGGQQSGWLRCDPPEESSKERGES